jgi:hypothetical protein
MDTTDMPYIITLGEGEASLDLAWSRTAKQCDDLATPEEWTYEDDGAEEPSLWLEEVAEGHFD